jgi:hypothetical protein
MGCPLKKNKKNGRVSAADRLLLNNIVLCITIYILYCPISFQIAVLELL